MCQLGGYGFLGGAEGGEGRDDVEEGIDIDRLR
jgi:hypothetical protein